MVQKYDKKFVLPPHLMNSDIQMIVQTGLFCFQKDLTGTKKYISANLLFVLTGYLPCRKDQLTYPAAGLHLLPVQ